MRNVNCDSVFSTADQLTGQSQWATVFGLALKPASSARGEGGLMIELDFVPNWYRSSQRRRSELTLRITVLCLLVAVMLIWSLRNLTNVRAAEADLAAVRSSYQLQSGALEQLDDLQAQLNQLDQRRQLVERVRGGLSSDQILARDHPSNASSHVADAGSPDTRRADQVALRRWSGLRPTRAG